MVETSTVDTADSESGGASPPESGGTSSELFARAEEVTTDRMISYVIDFVILSVVAFAIWGVGAVLGTITSATITYLSTEAIPEYSSELLMVSGVVSLGITLGVWLVLAAALLAYFTYLDVGDGTLGKRFNDLEVAMEDGSQLTKRETATRTAILLAPLPVMALSDAFLPLGFTLALFMMAGWLVIEAAMMHVNDGGQRIGDRVAGTVVVSSD